MATPEISLKLLVDKKGQRVLFAEAPKEFVDFIFHIFSLPLGTLIEFIGSKEMVGCLGKLKDSIESIHGTYLQPGVEKDNIFNPKTPFNARTFLLSYKASTDQASSSKAIYRCSNASEHCYNCSNRSSCRSNATLDPKSICPNCSGSMNIVMTRIHHKDVEEEVAAMEKINQGGGYVKEVVTYMVMDDLVVKPMSTISSITLINNFGVKDLSQLEEKIVTFGKEEVGELAGIAVGSAVCINSILGGPISGGSMNPARTIGPALASNTYKGRSIAKVFRRDEANKNTR